MKPKVYIETSIPSAYVTNRTSHEALARKKWTRDWWDRERPLYDPVISVAVIDEIEKGIYPTKIDALKLIDNIPLIPLEPEVTEIVEAYIMHKLMPVDPTGDALHLALASYHKCDFLLTWNCKHLANANKYNHIRRINTILGLYIPHLITPLELLSMEEAE